MIDYISDTLFIIGIPIALILFYKIFDVLKKILTLLYYNTEIK